MKRLQLYGLPVPLSRSPAANVRDGDGVQGPFGRQLSAAARYKQRRQEKRADAPVYGLLPQSTNEMGAGDSVLPVCGGTSGSHGISK